MEQRLFSYMRLYHVWYGDMSSLDSNGVRLDAYRSGKGVKEIESGKYHKIVLVDH